MINKQLGDMNLMKNFGCTVTRVRRSGIDLSPSPDLTLKFGDKLMVVGEKEGLKGLARLLGNNAKNCQIRISSPLRWVLYWVYYSAS